MSDISDDESKYTQKEYWRKLTLNEIFLECENNNITIPTKRNGQLYNKKSKRLIRELKIL